MPDAFTEDMHHLFSPKGEAALRRVLHLSPMLAFDFDGTLAPIVARPSDARLTRAVSSRLAKLAGQLPVAIVTGRSVEDVRLRLGFEPHFIVGNHGAEDSHTPAVDASTRGPLEALLVRLVARRSDLERAGVLVEDKVHSIALHYRLARDRDAARQLILELVNEQEPAIRVFGGKMVVNVAPLHAPDKAQAVRSLLERAGTNGLIFAGDDVNDEPVFAAAEPDWLTIRVGRESTQTGAMYFLDSPQEMAMLLGKMISILDDS